MIDMTVIIFKLNCNNENAFRIAGKGFDSMRACHYTLCKK